MVLNDSVIAEIVRRLTSVSHLKQVILFGSHARETADTDSDVDLLVIQRTVDSKHVEILKLRKALRGLLFPFDVLVVSEDEFNVRSQVNSTVYFWAKKEGRVIYDAAA